MTAFSLVQWTHPNLGEIREEVCSEHEAELLGALRVLGIGAVGQAADPASTCLRCAFAGTPARVWLRRFYAAGGVA